MTSVVGILNKRGVAIAADSAVTRSIGTMEKVTKNGNKMVRLSDVDPITVMFTGNGAFLSVTWDVIARKYRQQRGMIHHSTVEDLARDFFDYIASTPVFWSDEACDRILKYLTRKVFDEANNEISILYENARKRNGTMVRPATFRKAFIQNLRAIARDYSGQGRCPQFEGYTIEQFRKSASGILDDFFNDKYDANLGNYDIPDILKDPAFDFFNSPKSDYVISHYPKDVLEAIRPVFEETLLTVMGSRIEDDFKAVLVFAGYGNDQKYPSLVSATVCEGYDFKVNYTINPKDIVCISDRRPVAICPFAQDDVIKSLIRGVYEGWSENALSELQDITNPWGSNVFDADSPEEEPDFEFNDLLDEVESDDLHKKFTREAGRLQNAKQRKWEKALERYDLEEMATLADSLINLTEFHRILTFSQEGVGGLVDLAVISRNEGFTWLRRKSWYNKDNGGFGI